MIRIKDNSLTKFYILFIYLIFIIGFLFQENAGGGGEVDIKHIYHNILLFKSYDFSKIPWKLYESSGLPLYYIVTKYLIPFKHVIAYKIFTFSISLFCTFIFYKIIKLNFNLKSLNFDILLISSIPLLSPYFRTSGYWGLEDNFAYLLFLIATFFFLKSKKEKKYYSLTILLTCLTFYTRQNYAFLAIIVFFNFFNFKKFFSKNNFYTSIQFVLFLLPSFYFFYKFGKEKGSGAISLTAAVERINFDYFNLPIILSIFFFYYIPIIFINYKKFIIFLSSKIKLFYISILFLIYYFFFKFNHQIILNKKLGYGIIYKFFFSFGIFNNIPEIALFLFLFISFLGFMISTYFSIKSFNYFIYFIISLILFSFVDIVFQKYFCPLIYFVIIIFGNFLRKDDIKYSSRVFFYFYIIFLIVTLIYRYCFNIN